jgi:hypothetical protein
VDGSPIDQVMNPVDAIVPEHLTGLLGLFSPPFLQIKLHPIIMSGDVGESEPDSERNTGCSIFLFGAN